MEALSRIPASRDPRLARTTAASTGAPAKPLEGGSASQPGVPVDEIRHGTPSLPGTQPILLAPNSTRSANEVTYTAPVAEPTQDDLDGCDIRTWVRGADGTARLAVVAPTAEIPPARPLGEITEDDLKARLDQAGAARQTALREGGTSSNAAVVPEDGSMRVTAYHIAHDASDLCTTPLIAALGQVGRIEGFNVLVAARRPDLRDKLPAEQHPNVHPAHLPGQRDPWMEDHGEMSVDGTLSIPARIKDRDLIDGAIAADRIRRFYGVEPPPDLQGSKLRSALAEHYPLADFPMCGSVDHRGNQEDLAAVATAGALPLRENFTHIEGGNLIVGKRADGTPYALVGRDSLAVSKALLERDLGRSVSDGEVRSFAARDLGLKPEEVFPVEQPHDFHLDMHMCPIGPGRILLHDSVEAARQQEQWLCDVLEEQRPRPPMVNAPGSEWAKHGRELEIYTRMVEGVERDLAHVHDVAKRRRDCEDRALLDLKAAGLRVDRVAGMLDSEVNPHYPAMNFLNCEQGTNAAGERFMIVNGGPRQAEEYFARRVLDELNVDVSRIHFLPREASAETLRRNGGINCRAKPDGYVG